MMAKNRNNTTDDSQRQSRKEILVARKQQEQTRQVRLAMAGVAGLIGLVFLIAILNEFIISPNRAVATVNEEKITLKEWQRRVRYERAQRIILLESQLEAFSGDVGIIQQFLGQYIVEFQDAEGIAKNTLDLMVNEAVIRQMAEDRGITVSEADVDARIGRVFNYFGGESPTPLPAPTETIVPTPSITPIVTDVTTDTVDSEPAATPGPTSTPRPTATPVSEESFNEQYSDLLAQYKDLGVSEETYRAVVRAGIYAELLVDVLADEQDLPTEAEHASIYLLAYGSEAEAEAGMALIQDGDFLTLWNTLRSAPAETDAGGSASEIQWRTREDLATLGEDLVDAIFTMPLNETSDIITRQIDEETSRYFIIQVSGRELRPLAESALEQKKAELLTNIVDQQLAGKLVTTELWRSRVPTQPMLDPKFWAPPTETPVGVEPVDSESEAEPSDGS